MSTKRSVIVSMRFPLKSAGRLRRLAGRRAWTPGDTGARLVVEGLRRSEFAALKNRADACRRKCS